MSGPAPDHVFREASGRVVAALAARFRDLDLAEEAFQDACVRAVADWREDPPRDPAAWLYTTARRIAIDRLRRRAVRERLSPEPPPPLETPEETAMRRDEQTIPDERLRLLFVCCHPAVAADARAALTLRLVCGMSPRELARAFLLTEAALAQRLTRARRKIGEAGISFEIPRPDQWAERVDAVLSTLEVAYAKAHEDAAGAGAHAGFAEEVLRLTGLLTQLLPREPEVLALAATVRFAEARRPARVDARGVMVPLSEQDPSRWRGELIADGEALLRAALGPRPGPRALQATIHAVHADRRRSGVTDWAAILTLYDTLLLLRDDPVIRVNRAAAVAAIHGPAAALAELDTVAVVGEWLPYQAMRARLLADDGRTAEAAQVYEAALALDPAPAERLYLAGRLAACRGQAR